MNRERLHRPLSTLTPRIPIRTGIADRSRIVGDHRSTAIASGAETAAFHAKRYSSGSGKLFLPCARSERHFEKRCFPCKAALFGSVRKLSAKCPQGVREVSAARTLPGPRRPIAMPNSGVGAPRLPFLHELWESRRLTKQHFKMGRRGPGSVEAEIQARGCRVNRARVLRDGAIDGLGLIDRSRDVWVPREGLCRRVVGRARVGQLAPDPVIRGR